MKSIASTTSTGVGAKKDDKKLNTKNFIVAIGLSITFGLGWGFGFLATSHDLLPVAIAFQVIFIIVVGMQGVLLFIFHGARNSEAQALWRSVFLTISRKTRKVYSLTQSTNETKTSKHASITASPSTDMGNHSFGRDAAKSPSPAFSGVTTDTTLDIEANPAYGHFERFKDGKDIPLDTNVAYETVKQDLSLYAMKGNVYEELK